MSSSKKPKKTGKPSTNLNAEDSIPTAEQININNLVEKALTRYKNATLADKKDKYKELSHLASITEEYLSCFALIGYSLQNEEVVILNTPTPKDESALIDLLRSTFIDIMNGRT